MKPLSVAAMTSSLNPTSKPLADLVLIDGYGFLFRAFFALPPLTRPDGMPIGAVLGFCNMLLRRLNTLTGHRVAVIFDAKGPTFRNEIYAAYKANREAPPEDLVPQFRLIRDAAAAFHLPCIELTGFEADDLIATYARQAESMGQNVQIISADKDLMQLVSDRIRMLDPMKEKDIGYDQVFDKFGVAPQYVIDVQALAGDSSDNVPGVPGIGIKTAAALIEEYGSLEALLARAEEIKQNKRRENLINFAEQARISYQLVKLRTDAPVPIALEDIPIYRPDGDKLKAYFKDQNFQKLQERLDTVFSSLGPIPKEKSTELKPIRHDLKTDYKIVTHLEELSPYLETAKLQGYVAIDTETDSLTPSTANLVGISLSLKPGMGIYLPVSHENSENFQKKELLQELKPLLEDHCVLKIGQNIKYDMQVFAQYGIALQPFDDTMLMSYVLDGGKHGHGLDELARTHFEHETISYKSLTGTAKAQITLDKLPALSVRDYACEDTDYTLRLHKRLKPRLTTEQGIRVYQRLDRPLVPILAKMEANGVKIDSLMLIQMSEEFAAQLSDLEAKIQQEAGYEFNVGSPKQVGDVLFGSMGLPGGKKTKTGAWSTGADVLEQLAIEGHKIAEDILEWRALSKLKSTYTDALPEKVDPKTGRVHTSFTMSVTNTGRLTSSDPNLQNIPIRTKEGRRIREAFIPETGYKFISVDYSQVELRLIAEMANIAVMKDAFANGVDIHALTASEVFDIPLEHIDAETRRAAKAINFGIIYGISGYGLARQLNVPQSDARAYIQKYMARFPELGMFMQSSIKTARQQGYVETLYRRRMYMPEINSKNYARRSFAERQAINAPLQGTAADIMKLAMIKVDEWLTGKEGDIRMLLQVHDELIFEAREDLAEDYAKTIASLMESITKGSIPLKADWGIGNNWAEAH